MPAEVFTGAENLRIQLLNANPGLATIFEGLEIVVRDLYNFAVDGITPEQFQDYNKIL